MIEQLVPFKVRLAAFEELEFDSLGRPVGDTMHRMATCSAVSYRLNEFKAKMMSEPFKTALKEFYDHWITHYPGGEWIVVGATPSYYIAAQPGKLTQSLPRECCVFIGLLEDNSERHMKAVSVDDGGC